MQIGPILNVTSAAPASAVQNPAGMTGVNGLAGQFGQNPLSLDPSAANTDINVGGQFSDLLAPNVKTAKVLLPIDNTDGTATKAETNTQAQISPVAVPVLPTFIDQPIQANVKKADENLIQADINSLNNKQPIFSPGLKTNVKNLVAASEVADRKLADQVSGKIALQQVAENDEVQDPEFVKAVANLTNPEKLKNLKPASGNGEQVLVPKLAADNTNQTLKPVADNAQQQLADAKSDVSSNTNKITAKILGVKDEKIQSEDSDETVSPTLTANLKDFAAQLKAKSFSDVQTAHQALAQSPVDQVKVQINQALATGANTIKIHLHPVELGMVDVDMDTDHEGNTKISITADKADTLALLKTDSQHLTKALADAGIKTDNAMMQFNLRGDSQGQQQREFSNNNFQQNNGNNSQPQNTNGGITGYSRFTNLNEQTLTLSANKGLNILV